MSEWDGEERRNQWYTNKDLFEMIGKLNTELSKTTQLISRYNGLLERQTSFEGRLKNLEVCIDKQLTVSEYKKGVSLTIRSWWPMMKDIIIIGIIPLLIYILKVVSELR